MDQPTFIEDSQAFVFQSWAAFALSSSITLIGILYMPIAFWMRGFLLLGLLFTISSCITLAKTLRDRHEAKKLHQKLDLARAEEVLRTDRLRAA